MYLYPPNESGRGACSEGEEENKGFIRDGGIWAGWRVNSDQYKLVWSVLQNTKVTPWNKRAMQGPLSLPWNCGLIPWFCQSEPKGRQNDTWNKTFWKSNRACGPPAILAWTLPPSCQCPQLHFVWFAVSSLFHLRVLFFKLSRAPLSHTSPCYLPSSSYAMSSIRTCHCPIYLPGICHLLGMVHDGGFNTQQPFHVCFLHPSLESVEELKTCLSEVRLGGYLSKDPSEDIHALGMLKMEIIDLLRTTSWWEQVSTLKQLKPVHQSWQKSVKPW